MVTTPPAAPRAGALLALVGIVLVALNLRTAVAVFSPIVDQIGRDVPLDTVSIGVLGALPPVCFALFGLLAPAISRRLGLELTVVVGLAAMIAGHLVRAGSSHVVVFGVGTILALAGMGLGNVLLPPLVKKYFPGRIGPLTSVTTVMMSISTGVPSLVAAPLADGAGWRVAIGTWALVAVVALVPWVALLVEHHRHARRERAAALAGADRVEEAPAAVTGRVFRSPVAWALVGIQAASSFNAYAMFAWLPALLQDTAGQSPVASGALLAVFGFMGLPAAIVMPILAARMRNVGILIQVGVLFFVVGYVGLLVAPAAAPLLWVAAAGSGPLLFPLVFVLINLRTRTHGGVVALSGFVQGIGYSIGALGPLLFGILHEATGGWTVPLLMLFSLVAVASASGFYLARPRMLEDTWDRAARDEAARVR
ncbi:MFS transporter [Clavibacter michiganensis]|nr:MFS transporter [Clavibacter michiganensis]